MPNGASKVPLPRLQSSLPSLLICFARQVEVREDAVHVRRHDWPRRADVGFVQLVITSDAEQRQADADLVFEDLEQPHDTRPPGRGNPIEGKPNYRDNIG